MKIQKRLIPVALAALFSLSPLNLFADAAPPAAPEKGTCAESVANCNPHRLGTVNLKTEQIASIDAGDGTKVLKLDYGKMPNATQVSPGSMGMGAKKVLTFVLPPTVRGDTPGNREALMAMASYEFLKLAWPDAITRSTVTWGVATSVQADPGMWYLLVADEGQLTFTESQAIAMAEEYGRQVGQNRKEIAQVREDLAVEADINDEQDQQGPRGQAGLQALYTPTGSVAGGSVGGTLPLSSRVRVVGSGLYGLGMTATAGEQSTQGTGVGGQGGLEVMATSSLYFTLKGGYYAVLPSKELQAQLEQVGPLYTFAPLTGGFVYERAWGTIGLEAGVARSLHYQVEGAAWQFVAGGRAQFVLDLDSKARRERVKAKRAEAAATP